VRVFALVMFVLAIVMAVGLGPATPLSGILLYVNPALPGLVQSFVQTSLPNWFWDPVTVELLRWPGWIFAVIIGVFSLLVTIGRPSRRV
jgi:hypothetical protein